MNWVKIDHDKLDELPLGTGVLVTFDKGQVFHGDFVMKLSGLIEFNGTSKTSKKIKQVANYFTHYAIIEDPKQGRKYNSVEEFYSKTNFIIKTWGSKHENPEEFFINYTICKYDGLPMFTVSSKDRDGCDKKLLDWANDES